MYLSAVAKKCQLIKSRKPERYTPGFLGLGYIKSYIDQIPSHSYEGGIGDILKNKRGLFRDVGNTEK